MDLPLEDRQSIAHEIVDQALHQGNDILNHFPHPCEVLKVEENEALIISTGTVTGSEELVCTSWVIENGEYHVKR
jgi:hypothetical protein